jgi:hypothetical protein
MDNYFTRTLFFISIILSVNHHASNDCESPSGSDNIATRVRARNEKARKKKVHTRNYNILWLGIV